MQCRSKDNEGLQQCALDEDMLLTESSMNELHSRRPKILITS